MFVRRTKDVYIHLFNSVSMSFYGEKALHPFATVQSHLGCSLRIAEKTDHRVSECMLVFSRNEKASFSIYYDLGNSSCASSYDRLARRPFLR